MLSQVNSQILLDALSALEQVHDSVESVSTALAERRLPEESEQRVVNMLKAMAGSLSIASDFFIEEVKRFG